MIAGGGACFVSDAMTVVGIVRGDFHDLPSSTWPLFVLAAAVSLAIALAGLVLVRGDRLLAEDTELDE